MNAKQNQIKKFQAQIEDVNTGLVLNINLQAWAMLEVASVLHGIYDEMMRAATHPMPSAPPGYDPKR